MPTKKKTTKEFAVIPKRSQKTRDIYIKIRKNSTVNRTLAIDPQINLDKNEDEDIIAVEILGALEISIDGVPYVEIASRYV